MLIHQSQCSHTNPTKFNFLSERLSYQVFCAIIGAGDIISDSMVLHTVSWAFPLHSCILKVINVSRYVEVVPDKLPDPQQLHC